VRVLSSNPSLAKKKSVYRKTKSTGERQPTEWEKIHIKMNLFPKKINDEHEKVINMTD
jgi:hypothetical protein